MAALYVMNSTPESIGLTDNACDSFIVTPTPRGTQHITSLPVPLNRVVWTCSSALFFILKYSFSFWELRFLAL